MFGPRRQGQAAYKEQKRVSNLKDNNSHAHRIIPKRTLSCQPRKQPTTYGPMYRRYNSAHVSLQARGWSVQFGERNAFGGINRVNGGQWATVITYV
jgi:hypothetical protein